MNGEKLKRLGSTLFSNCYKMKATLYVPINQISQFKQVNYCDLDDGILNLKSIENDIKEPNQNKFVEIVDPDSSLVLDFKRKIFVQDATLTFTHCSDFDIIRINKIDRDSLPMFIRTCDFYSAEVILCMQKEDIPYIKELLFYSLSRNCSYIDIDDREILQYELEF